MKKDLNYLHWLKSKPCLITGSTTDVVAHHVRCYPGWVNVSDYRTVPLTTMEHAMLRFVGETSYWTSASINVRYAVIANLLQYLKDVCHMTDLSTVRHTTDLAGDKSLAAFEDEIVRRTIIM